MTFFNLIPIEITASIIKYCPKEIADYDIFRFKTKLMELYKIWDQRKKIKKNMNDKEYEVYEKTIIGENVETYEQYICNEENEICLKYVLDWEKIFTLICKNKKLFNLIKWIDIDEPIKKVITSVELSIQNKEFTGVSKEKISEYKKIIDKKNRNFCIAKLIDIVLLNYQEKYKHTVEYIKKNFLEMEMCAYNKIWVNRYSTNFIKFMEDELRGVKNFKQVLKAYFYTITNHIHMHNLPPHDDTIEWYAEDMKKELMKNHIKDLKKMKSKKKFYEMIKNKSKIKIID